MIRCIKNAPKTTRTSAAVADALTLASPLLAACLFAISPSLLNAQGTMIVPFGQNKEVGPAHETYRFPYRENYIMLPLTNGSITENGGKTVIVNKPVSIHSKRPTVIPLGNGAPNVSPTPVVPQEFNGGYVMRPNPKRPQEDRPESYAFPSQRRRDLPPVSNCRTGAQDPTFQTPTPQNSTSLDLSNANPQTAPTFPLTAPQNNSILVPEQTSDSFSAPTSPDSSNSGASSVPYEKPSATPPSSNESPSPNPYVPQTPSESQSNAYSAPTPDADSTTSSTPEADYGNSYGSDYGSGRQYGNESGTSSETDSSSNANSNQGPDSNANSTPGADYGNSYGSDYGSGRQYGNESGTSSGTDSSSNSNANQGPDSTTNSTPEADYGNSYGSDYGNESAEASSPIVTTNPQSAWQTPNSTNDSFSAGSSVNERNDRDDASPMIDTRSQYSTVQQAIQSSKPPLQSQTEPRAISLPSAASQAQFDDSFSNWNSVEVRPRFRSQGGTFRTTLPIETEDDPQQLQERPQKIPTRLPPPDPESAPNYQPEQTSEGRKV